MALKVMFDRRYEFEKRVGMMAELIDFAGMPIQPDTAFCAFLRNQRRELLEFVAKYPDYHIVTIVLDGYALINRYVENAHGWYLAEGDDDPSLIEAASNAWRYAVDIDEVIAEVLDEMRQKRLRKA